MNYGDARDVALRAGNRWADQTLFAYDGRARHRVVAAAFALPKALGRIGMDVCGVSLQDEAGSVVVIRHRLYITDHIGIPQEPTCNDSCVYAKFSAGGEGVNVTGFVDGIRRDDLLDNVYETLNLDLAVGMAASRLRSADFAAAVKVVVEQGMHSNSLKELPFAPLRTA